MDACAKHGVECRVYGAGTNKFDTPPVGKDKFSIMMEFYQRTWGMTEPGADPAIAAPREAERQPKRTE